MNASTRHRSLTLLFVLGAMTGCQCGDTPIFDDTFDGNVIIGDAAPDPDGRIDVDGFVDDDGGPDGSESDGFVGDRGNIGPSDGALDGGEDCALAPIEVLNATAAVARRADIANQVVEITGTATTSAVTCESGECLEAGACACRCTARLSIDALVVLEASPCFDDPGCTGDVCTMVCTPAVLGLPRRFRGRARLNQDMLSLELFSVLP